MRSKCPCYACTRQDVRDNPARPESLVLGQDPRLMRMFLCETCGNKRCPHAADHRRACTGSNEPGQPGSLYENVAPAEPWLTGEVGSEAVQGIGKSNGTPQQNRGGNIEHRN